MRKENPFVIKGYKSKDYFCDRESELEKLLLNVRNNIDTTLISPRRLGKTGLIHRFFDELGASDDFETIYVDIYPARSLIDFIQLLAEAILKKFPEKSTIGGKFIEFIKGFRPLIGYDAVSGEPQIQITYQTNQEKEYSLQNLLQFIDNQDKKIVLAIDEFQQITEFPEKNIEALLRTYTQQLRNIRFVYCGSKKTIMIDLFSNAKRPFYASTQFLMIDKIDEALYLAFIRKHFNFSAISIDDDALAFILFWSKRHTFYTQCLCNKIFSTAEEHVKLADVKNACKDLMKSNEAVFFQYRQLLTPAQWNFMIAVAKENEVKQPTAQHFISKYNIGTPANARRILKSLIDKELILETVGKKEKNYQVYDVFLSRWLESEY